MSVDGKLVVVTGASDGIGRAAATALVNLGAQVVVVGRSAQKTAEVASNIGAAGEVADFAELGQVRALGARIRERFDRVDVLINNAGGYWRHRQITSDGFELTMQVNHLAPFLLTGLLLPAMPAGARVITTSSAAHRLGSLRPGSIDRALAGHHPFLGWRAYGTSKLANVLFASELARRNPEIVSTSFHPGVVASEFGRDGGITGLYYALPMARASMTTVEGGAATGIWLATANAGWRAGGYHERSAPASASRAGRNPALAAALWTASEAALRPS